MKTKMPSKSGPTDLKSKVPHCIVEGVSGFWCPPYIYIYIYIYIIYIFFYLQRKKAWNSTFQNVARCKSKVAELWSMYIFQFSSHRFPLFYISTGSFYQREKSKTKLLWLTQWGCILRFVFFSWTCIVIKIHNVHSQVNWCSSATNGRSQWK